MKGKNLGANNSIELELDSWQSKKMTQKYISNAFYQIEGLD